MIPSPTDNLTTDEYWPGFSNPYYLFYSMFIYSVYNNIFYIHTVVETYLADRVKCALKT